MATKMRSLYRTGYPPNTTLHDILILKHNEMQQGKTLYRVRVGIGLWEKLKRECVRFNLNPNYVFGMKIELDRGTLLSADTERNLVDANG